MKQHQSTMIYKMNFSKLPVLFVLLMTSLFLSSCEKRWKKEGSGIVQTSTRNVADFDMIESYGSFDISYYQSEGVYVVVKTDNNIIHDVKTYVRGEVLHIEMDEEYHNYDYTLMKIEVYGPIINHVELNGAIDFVMEDMVTSENLRIDHSGSGSARARYSGGHLRMGTNGSADMAAIGECDYAEYHIHGSGKVDAVNMIAYDALADIFGSGDIYLHCEHDLTVNISGSGDVRYLGNPTITTEISGSGDVGPY